MNRLGVAVSWRVVASYWVGLIFFVLGLAALGFAYFWLREVAPWLFEGRRPSVASVVLGSCAGLLVVIVLKYGMPIILTLFGAAPVDHLGYKRGSGDEAVVPDYPETLRDKGRANRKIALMDE